MRGYRLEHYKPESIELKHTRDEGLGTRKKLTRLMS